MNYPARFVSLTFGVKTREELDVLVGMFLAFERKFKRDVLVESRRAIADIQELLAKDSSE